MDKGKITGFVAAAVAVALLLLAAFSNSWLIGRNYDIESKVGLRSVDTCVDETCTRVSLSDWSQSAYAPDGLSTFRTLGMISFVLALGSVAAMLMLLAYRARGKPPNWPVHPGSIGLLLSISLLMLGVLTLALHPFKSSGWSTGPGFMLLAGGDVAALLAALILGRSEEPTVDNWFE